MDISHGSTILPLVVFICRCILISALLSAILENVIVSVLDVPQTMVGILLCFNVFNAS